MTTPPPASEAYLRIAERYRGLAFRWEKWSRPHEDWDHDHCFFCRACICDSGARGHYAHAFVVRHEEDSPFWVCRSCFKAVRAVLDWRIERRAQRLIDSTSTSTSA